MVRFAADEIHLRSVVRKRPRKDVGVDRFARAEDAPSNLQQLGTTRRRHCEADDFEIVHTSLRAARNHHWKRFVLEDDAVPAQLSHLEQQRTSVGHEQLRLSVAGRPYVGSHRIGVL